MPAPVGRRLAQRLRRPSLAMAFLAVLAFYLGDGFIVSPSPLGLRHPLVWVDYLLMPAMLIGGIVWLSPIPWQWNGRRSDPPAFGRGLVQALLATWAWVSLAVAGELAVRRWLHARSPSLLNTWFYYLTLHGSATVLIGGLMAAREREEEEKLASRAQAVEAQTRLLQSQLHPHVLFNSLNGLAELIVKQSPKAETSVRALSDLLRRLLDASETATCELWEEQALVRAYLDLEALRLGSRLRLSWDWDPAADAVPVIPMVLQPLVENAIKHGIAPAEDGGELKIRARREDGALVLEVWNSGRLDAGSRAADAPRTSIGVKNLRSRLDLAYGGRADFLLAEAGGGVLARIKLPVQG